VALHHRLPGCGQKYTVYPLSITAGGTVRQYIMNAGFDPGYISLRRVDQDF